MKVLFDDLAVCVDCLMYIANGEVQDDGRDITSEHAEKMRAQWGDHLVHMVSACQENCDGWFSWTECDGCGSPFGGERHPAAVLGNEGSE